MQRPDAVLILEQLKEKLSEEQRRREAFYKLDDEDLKAEFVNGEIFYQPSVPKEHIDAVGAIACLLNIFTSAFHLGYVGIERILTQFTRNDYLPDVCFFKQDKAADFKKGQLIFPVPDLVVEVLSKSSKRMMEHDTVTKYADYEKHGVPEYWIVDPDEQTVSQYVLENGKYRLVLKSGEGTIRSFVVEGFAIPIRAIFDEEANLAAVREMFK